MKNIPRIQKVSTAVHVLISVLLVVIPLYYGMYWAFINDLPETLITVNTPHTPLAPSRMPILLQIAGFCACLLPLSALTWGLIHIRKIFSLYKEGVIFSFEHVRLFKNTAKALLLWVFLSIVYESVKSILFSAGNPPGTRVVTVGFGTAEITTIVVAFVVFVIAWVMDEGRLLAEETELTV